MNKKIYITSLHLMHGGVEMAITALSNALVRRGFSYPQIREGLKALEMDTDEFPEEY